MCIIIKMDYLFTVAFENSRDFQMCRQFSLYVLSFCMISLQCNLKIYTTFGIYAIIFGLAHFGIDSTQYFSV